MSDLIRKLRNYIEQDAQVSIDAMREAADRLTLYETALRKLQKAAAGYVHPERTVTAEELIDTVLAVVDDGELVRAMRGDRPPEQ